MSTHVIYKWEHAKHARIDKRTTKATEYRKGLTKASLALMLSASTAAVTQGASFAFASEADETEDAPVEEAVPTAELAESSLAACVNALTVDLGVGASLMDTTVHDADKARAVWADALIDEAYQHLGTPYVYGGTTPAGFDCSGFTGYVFRNALGMELPRSAAAQSGLGEDVSWDEAQRGDLIFWGGRGGVYHTGIYLGDGDYIHASASKGIRIQSVSSYAPSFAKRVF